MIKKAVFKNKNGTNYVQFDDKYFNVYYAKDFKPNFKEAKNGRIYFVANLTECQSKSGNIYYVASKIAE